MPAGRLHFRRAIAPGERSRQYKIKHRHGRTRKNVGIVRARTARAAVKKLDAIVGGYLVVESTGGRVRKFAASLAGTARDGRKQWRGCHRTDR